MTREGRDHREGAFARLVGYRREMKQGCTEAPMSRGAMALEWFTRLAITPASVSVLLGLAACSSAPRLASAPSAPVVAAPESPAPSGTQSAPPEKELMEIVVRLHDRQLNPIPGVAYQLTLPSGEMLVGETDSEGDLHASIAKAETTITVTYQPANEPRPVTIKSVLFPPEEGETDRALLQEILNMGFGAEGASATFAILRFQTAKNLRRTGKLDDATKKAVREDRFTE